DPPTLSLARRFAGALPPSPRLRRDLAEALCAEAGRSRGSLAWLARVVIATPLSPQHRGDADGDEGAGRRVDEVQHVVVQDPGRLERRSQPPLEARAR